MFLIEKNKVNNINKILALVNIILFVTLIFSIIPADKHSILDVEDSETLCYQWNILHIEYDGLSKDSVINKLGAPNKVKQISIYEQNYLGFWNPLTFFKKHPDDTVSFEQLYYRQGEFDFYLWLLPDKDSVWRVVDAIKFDPESVQF